MHLSHSLRSLNELLKTRLAASYKFILFFVLLNSSQCVEIAYSGICFTNLSESCTYSLYPEPNTMPNTEQAFDKYLLNEIRMNVLFLHVENCRNTGLSFQYGSEQFLVFIHSTNISRVPIRGQVLF